MSHEVLEALESKVLAVVEQHRRLRVEHDAVRGEADRRKAETEAFRRDTERTLRDLRSVLGSAVRILRED